MGAKQANVWLRKHECREEEIESERKRTTEREAKRDEIT